MEDAGRHLRPSLQVTLPSSTPSPLAATSHISTNNYDGHPQSPHIHHLTNNTSPEDNVDAVLGNPAVAESAAADAIPNDSLLDLKRPRACEACRQLKVRCDPDIDNPDGPCKRCAKAHRQCLVTAPTRKRQKKADSRVAELEKKIDALTATLEASRDRGQAREIQFGSSGRKTPEESHFSRPRLGQGHVSRDTAAGLISRPSQNNMTSASPASIAGNKRHFSGDIRSRVGANGIMAPLAARSHSPTGEGPSTAAPEGSSSDMKSFTSSFNMMFEPVQNHRADHEYSDVIDRGVVDPETAKKAFNRYVNEMAPLAPFVVFPPNTTMAEVRRNTPILFLSILAISINAFAPSLHVPLVNEVHRAFADQVVVRGFKSLELVQAILVSSIWYSPPDHYEELKIYQLIHMAILMGMDLGMNRRTKPNSKTTGILRELMGKRAPFVHPESLEGRRVWLGCYYMGVNVAIGMRRQLITRWHPYMDESIELLQNSPDALPSDRAVIQWVKLAHIGEEIGFQFSMDDPITNVSMSDPRVQYALKGFEGRLDEWRKEVPQDVYSPIMQHYEQVLNIFMHEIGIHIDHNIDDFKPPFLTEIGVEEPRINIATAAHVDALTACLTSMKKTFQIFCSLDWDVFHCLPTIHFVRTAYACVALTKLSAVTLFAGSSLSNVFNPADLQVEESLDKLVEHLKIGGENDASRVSAKFAIVISMLKAWYFKRRQTFKLPALFQPRGATDNTSGAELPSTGSTSNGGQKGAPSYVNSSPLHVLSEVAMGRPSDSHVDSNQQHGHSHHQEPPHLSNAHPNQTNIHPNSAASNSSNTASTITPISDPSNNGANPILTTANSWPQYLGQDHQMGQGIGPYPTPSTATTTNSQDMNHFPPAPYQQTQGFIHSGGEGGYIPAADPVTASTSQGNFWSQGIVPDVDLSMALAFHPGMWDEELISFALEGNDGGF